MRLLIVEDSPEYARLVATHTTRAGLLTDHVPDIDHAEAALGTVAYDLVVLDRRLPDGDGVAALRRLRARRPGLRVLVLTALDGTRDRVEGLEAGADDYVVKPVPMAELIARIRACLRRPGAVPTPPLSCGSVMFDPAERTVTVGGTICALSRRQLAVLEALIGRSGKVVLRESLEAMVYGANDEVQPNALDAQVSRLRRQLSALNAGVAIHVVRGVGYMLAAS